MTKLLSMTSIFAATLMTISGLAGADTILSSSTSTVDIPLITTRDGKSSYSATLKINGLGNRLKAEPPYTSGTYRVQRVEKRYNDSTITMDEGFDPEIADRLDDLLGRIVTDYEKPGAILAVQMGDKTWRGVAGVKRVGTKPPAQFSDTVRIGSITKTFVAALIMQLIEEGKFKLDDPIGRLMPELNIPRGDVITVRHLLSHRSGLHNYVVDFQEIFVEEPLKVFDPRQILADALKKPLESEPGAEYHYSNTGFSILGLLIEKTTRSTVEAQVKKRFLNAYNLSMTTFPTDPGYDYTYLHGHADYDCNENIRNGCPAGLNLKDISYLETSVPWAAGAMLSNAQDLLKWGKIYLDGQLVSPELHQLSISDCKSLGYEDLGIYGNMCLSRIQVFPSYPKVDAANTWIGHGGQIQGFDNIMYRNHAKDITVVLNMNHYYMGTDDNKQTPVIMLFDLLPIFETPETRNAMIARGKSARETIKRAVFDPSVHYDHTNWADR